MSGTKEPNALVILVKQLRSGRENRKALTKARATRRRSPSSSQRKLILARTNSRCHICGGDIDGRWNADHVLAHSGGGEANAENFLPAHETCNNYRWDYLADEFRLILKLGVWTRTQVERETAIGRVIAERYLKDDVRRRRRRKV